MDFEELRDDFLAIVTDVVWSTMRRWTLRVGLGRAWCTRTGMSSTGARSGEWAVLRLDPWRVMILTAADAAAGRWYQRVWRS